MIKIYRNTPNAFDHRTNETHSVYCFGNERARIERQGIRWVVLAIDHSDVTTCVRIGSHKSFDAAVEHAREHAKRDCVWLAAGRLGLRHDFSIPGYVAAVDNHGVVRAKSKTLDLLFDDLVALACATGVDLDI